MCWYSAEQANEIVEAKPGERLAIKRMNWHANWVVRETEVELRSPTPVCILDQTKVLFRVSENEQQTLHLGPEAEAVFRMRRLPRRDVFEFSDGRRINLESLPAGLMFDVLVVPGSEGLSEVLGMEPTVSEEEEKK